MPEELRSNKESSKSAHPSLNVVATPTVLITGAFGNLGLMCIDQALAAGYHIHCFDLDTPQTRKLAQGFEGNPKIKITLGNLLQRELIPGLVKDTDAIIHNASVLPPVTELKPEVAWEINVNGTIELARAAAESNPSTKFIFPSSVTVFGPSDSTGKEKSVQDSPLATDNYTRHKLECERAIKNLDLDWIIVRVGVSVDARTTHTDLNTLKTLLSVRAGNPLEWVHPKDVALAMCNAIEKEQAVKKTLLLGGGKSCQITHGEFLGCAIEACGLKLDPSIHGNNSYYTHWMDTTESQEILDFQQHSFVDYKREMNNSFRWVRRSLFPIRPLANAILNLLFRWLTPSSESPSQAVVLTGNKKGDI